MNFCRLRLISSCSEVNRGIASCSSSSATGFCRSQSHLAGAFPLSKYPVSQAACDDLLHHFVGAGIDAVDAGVLVGAGDRIFAHVAIAAEQLQAGVYDPAFEF